MIFSFDKSTSLEGGSEKEIIIGHPLDKLYECSLRDIRAALLTYFRFLS